MQEEVRNRDGTICRQRTSERINGRPSEMTGWDGKQEEKKERLITCNMRKEKRKKKKLFVFYGHFNLRIIHYNSCDKNLR